MNAENLLAHFERISEAPDAIKRLRRFILDLAVRGKLVDSENSLVKCTLGSLGEWGSGGTPLKSHPEYYGGDIPWLVIGDLNDGLVTNVATHITKAGLENSSAKMVETGTVLIAMYGSIGKLGIAGIQCCTNQAIAFCRPDSKKVTRDYLFLMLRSLREQLLSRGQGVAQQNISQKILKAHPVSLPALSEQHRIVTKVDELMNLCDQLEAAKAEREKCRDNLVAASMQGLNQPTEEEETFREHARFTFNNLPRITTRATHIKQLRQSILNLAVRGKLVSQDPSDEPAAELLKKIADKRTTLLKAGYPNLIEAKTQAKKLEEQAIPNAIQPLPMGWAWATLMQCSALVVDCKNKTAPYASKGIRLIRTTNVRNGRLNLTDQKYVDQSTYESWSARCTPEPRDILITREAPMGEVCLIPPGEQICLGQRMMLARLLPGTIDCNFMIYSLRDPKLMDRVQDKPVGATVQHLRVGGVETLLVPLPPLAEQQRIVAKVDELMAICDQLEAQITTTEQDSRRFLESVLADALAPGIDLSAEVQVA